MIGIGRVYKKTKKDKRNHKKLSENVENTFFNLLMEKDLWSQKTL